MDEFLATGERLVTQALAQNKARLVTCPGAPGCDRMFISSFGRRAFRRPLTADEVQRYSLLFAPSITNASFDKGVELAIRAMLASPHFLYRSEVGERAADGSFRLTAFELATSMSYPAGGQHARRRPAGCRRSPAALDSPQGDRDPGPAPAAGSAQPSGRWRRSSGSGWASTGSCSPTRTPSSIPTFTDEVRKAMAEEADAFVASVALDSAGSGGSVGTFKDLFAADYVFTNDTLSRFYGLPGTGGATLSRQPAGSGAARKRGGVLTLGAVLGAHAHSNESSPVRRGVFVRHQLLCQSLPSPPENLNVMPPGLDPSLTTRARFQRHSSDAACEGLPPAHRCAGLRVRALRRGGGLPRDRGGDAHRRQRRGAGAGIADRDRLGQPSTGRSSWAR